MYHSYMMQCLRVFIAEKFCNDAIYTNYANIVRK